ncbi:hypothetical protein JXJ21_13925 [candidate division KSB1 bacterium]|nr:hypothetical protein [candidate division KSB1 bacterium]
MKSMIILVLAGLLCSIAVSAESPKTLAVLDFSNNSLIKKDEFSTLSKGIAEMFITELSQIELLTVVERQQLNSIVEEMSLSQSGLIDQGSQVKVGKIVGAHYLVLGSFMVAFGDKIRLDARIVHVETGRTLNAGKAEGKTKKILELISKLTKNVLKNLDIKLTKSEKAKLDETGDLSIEAVKAFSQGVDAEDHGDIAAAKKYYRQALQLDSKFTAAKIRLKKLSSKRIF